MPGSPLQPLIAAIPCRATVCWVHLWVGVVVVGGWFALFLVGLLAFVVRREPPFLFWRLLGILQVLLGVQLVAGLALLVGGHRADTWRHYMYGVVGPVVVLVLAHVLGRDMQDEKDTWKVFAAASFFVFGLTLMALFTGLRYV